MRKKVFSVILLLIALLVLGGCTQQSIQGDAGRVLNRQSESSDDLNSPKDAPELDIRAKQIAPEIQDGLNRIFEEHPYLAGEFVDHVKLQELAEKHGITLHNHLKDTIHDPYGRVSVVLYRFDEIFAQLIETGFDPNHYWRFEVGRCIDNATGGSDCAYHACGGLTNCPDPCTCAVKTFRQHAVQG